MIFINYEYHSHTDFPKNTNIQIPIAILLIICLTLARMVRKILLIRGENVSNVITFITKF